MTNRTRNKAVTLRMTEDEFAFFQTQMNKSKKENQTDFFLSVLRKKPIIVIDELVPILVELKRQGNNLNQLTRQINEGTQLDEIAKNILDKCYQTYEKLLDFEVG
ncbi:plasmid mobilization relaxosome protein MobC [bacterium]|nr:plasmid mobilization relaxosome protein MobC [bacterium]